MSHSCSSRSCRERGGSQSWVKTSSKLFLTLRGITVLCNSMIMVFYIIIIPNTGLDSSWFSQCYLAPSKCVPVSIHWPAPDLCAHQLLAPLLHKTIHTLTHIQCHPPSKRFQQDSVNLALISSLSCICSCSVLCTLLT